LTVLGRVALACGVVLTLALSLAQSGAGAVASTATLKPIGYVYTSTPGGSIDQFAVAPDRTLTLAGTVAAPTAQVMGLSLLHTPGGLHLYALTSDGDNETIIQYSVDVATGKLSRDKVPAVTGVRGVQDADAVPSSGLLGYDGYGTNGSGDSSIYALKCVDPTCTQRGLRSIAQTQRPESCRWSGRSLPARSTRCRSRVTGSTSSSNSASPRKPTSKPSRSTTPPVPWSEAPHSR
jgi:hypothetical protein